MTEVTKHLLLLTLIDFAKEGKKMSSNSGEVVVTKMNGESSEMIVVPGDDYALIDSNKRRAHICW